jgi:hypothetical protein
MVGTASERAKNHWLGLPGWTEEETAYLLLGCLFDDEEGYLFDQDGWPEILAKTKDYIKRAGLTGLLLTRGGLFIPEEIVRWVSERPTDWPAFPFDIEDLNVPTSLGVRKEPKRRVLVMPLQEEAILEALAALEYDPMALPKLEKGGPRPKLEARQVLCGRGGSHGHLFPEGGRQFDKAWGRLLDKSAPRIAYR